MTLERLRAHAWRAWPVAALVLAVLGPLTAAATVLLAATSPGPGTRLDPEVLADVVVAATFPVAAWVVARWRPRNAAALVLALGVLPGLGALARELALREATSGGIAVPAGVLALAANLGWLGYWVQPSLLPLLLPTGELPSPRWRNHVRVVVGLLLAGGLAAAFRPGDVDGLDGLGVTNPLGFGSADAGFVAVMATSSLLVAGPMTVLALVGLRGKLRRSTGIARTRLEWLLLGFAMCAGAALASAAVIGAGVVTDVGRAREVTGAVLLALAFAAIPATIAVGVARHDLFDVEPVARKAVAFAALSALGLGSYVAVVAVAGIRGSSADAGFAALVAFAVAATRGRVQRVVDERLFGVPPDPLRVLARVNEVVAGDTSLARLARATTVLGTELRVSYLELDLDAHGSIARIGRPPSAGVHETPVIVGAHRAGTLRAALPPGSAREPTRGLIAEAARAFGTALHEHSLAEELARERSNLVAATAEERRLVLRELHDGVGPSLAGMALQLESLQLRLPPDPDLQVRATALAERLQLTVAEVRGLVHGLRSAPVDELGLEQALLTLGDPADRQVEVRVHGPLPTLPAALELAAYRVASEAVANLLRHARARRGVVEIGVRDGELALAVTDDGIGFCALESTAPGLGLASIAERAAEVGGRSQICSEPGRGTTVHAWFPIPQDSPPAAARSRG